ncbi:RNA polymerase II-associated protein 3 [Trichinella pseudospiralis]|uniref:RNA polymerase II-associated protein 3 n=1 Tax=Trichinella pseudospiralis TaxID=6337 RepID=A0A0V1F673_TRIPS|nr:RNA polymerase II-associated protein 3 [Trichinella pseudospiralis]
MVLDGCQSDFVPVTLTNRLCALIRCDKNSSEASQRIEELIGELQQLRKDIRLCFRGLDCSPEEQVRRVRVLYKELLLKDRLVKHLKQISVQLTYCQTVMDVPQNQISNLSHDVGPSTTEKSCSSNNTSNNNGKKLSLSCPKCSCIILRENHGEQVTVEKELPELSLKADGTVDMKTFTEFVRVDDIYDFENIGFSRNLNGVQYLLCAACEIGPLGFHDLTTKLSYVASIRQCFFSAIVLLVFILYCSTVNLAMLVKKERKDISEKDAQKALFEKESGNSFYVKKDYEKAIMCYSRSISADPFRPVVYCNRAMAYLKLKNYAEAYADCSKALTFDPTYVKALFRRGMASKGLNNFDDAVEDFQHVLTLDPNNDIAKKELEEIISKVKSAENDPLLVYPVEHPDEKEYQKPLKVIIVRDAVKKSQLNSQQPALSDESNVTKQSEQKSSDYELNASIKITRIPKCYAELRADWISIRDQPLALADYILNIPCDCFSNLLGEFLDGEFVANLLKAFMIKVNSEPQCSISCMERLELIGKAKRFDIVVLFLSRADFIYLKAVLDKAKHVCSKDQAQCWDDLFKKYIEMAINKNNNEEEEEEASVESSQ